jgi:hypothetical protein
MRFAYICILLKLPLEDSWLSFKSEAFRVFAWTEPAKVAHLSLLELRYLNLFNISTFSMSLGISGGFMRDV